MAKNDCCEYLTVCWVLAIFAIEVKVFSTVYFKSFIVPQWIRDNFVQVFCTSLNGTSFGTKYRLSGHMMVNVKQITDLMLKSNYDCTSCDKTT